MSDKNYLRKCPFCNCFFFSQHDLQLHVKAKHHQTITDVPPYNPKEEAEKRPYAKYVYQYKLATHGTCEVCGRKGITYKIATHWNTTLTRCENCLLDLMEKLKNIRFEKVQPHQRIRGWQIEETGQTALGKN